MTYNFWTTCIWNLPYYVEGWREDGAYVIYQMNHMHASSSEWMVPGSWRD